MSMLATTEDFSFKTGHLKIELVKYRSDAVCQEINEIKITGAFALVAWAGGVGVQETEATLFVGIEVWLR